MLNNEWNNIMEYYCGMNYEYVWLCAIEWEIKVMKNTEIYSRSCA